MELKPDPTLKTMEAPFMLRFSITKSQASKGPSRMTSVLDEPVICVGDGHEMYDPPAEAVVVVVVWASAPPIMLMIDDGKNPRPENLSLL